MDKLTFRVQDRGRVFVLLSCRSVASSFDGELWAGAQQRAGVHGTRVYILYSGLVSSPTLAVNGSGVSVVMWALRALLACSCRPCVVRLRLHVSLTAWTCRVPSSTATSRLNTRAVSPGHVCVLPRPCIQIGLYSALNSFCR